MFFFFFLGDPSTVAGGQHPNEVSLPHFTPPNFLFYFFFSAPPFRAPTSPRACDEDSR